MHTLIALLIHAYLPICRYHHINYTHSTSTIQVYINNNCRFHHSNYTHSTTIGVRTTTGRLRSWSTSSKSTQEGVSLPRRKVRTAYDDDNIDDDDEYDDDDIDDDDDGWPFGNHTYNHLNHM